jgi:cytoskeletal protein CcmA (bactofilin family)
VRLIDGMIARGLTLDEDARVTGLVAGKLIVSPGVRAEVAGMVSGDMIVEAGAEVALSGMVSGDLVNKGGTVTGSGLVSGERREG